MRARFTTVGAPARADARRGPRAGHRVPAPQSRELGDGGALGRATAPARAGADLANAADREAHALQRVRRADGYAAIDRGDSVCFRCPSTARSRQRPEALRVVCRAVRAPECFAPLTPGCPMSSESRTSHREFIRRGGEWWRFRDPRGRSRDRRITLSVRVLEAHALVGMPEASRLSVRRVTSTVRQAVFTGILIRLGALSDKWSQGWGRSSERQRRKRKQRCGWGQAPERAALFVVRAQRLVEG